MAVPRTLIRHVQKMFPKFSSLLTALLALFSGVCQAWANGDFALRWGPFDVVGNFSQTVSKEEETLLDIARRFDIGFFDIVRANPKVDAWLPGENTNIVLPTQYILPKSKREGIVINVPEFRLYHYYSDADSQRRVRTYPISIGRQDWKTPLGSTYIINKHENPVWRPPQSIRDEHAERGDILPAVVPAGPDNPLGAHALRLGIPGYLIHGTNKPYGIGMRVTHGCVRMYPEDVEELFHSVDTSTRVHIIDEPVKLGWIGDVLYLEVHHLEDGLSSENIAREELLEMTIALIEHQIDEIPYDLDLEFVNKVVDHGDGMPYPIWVKNR